MGLAEHVAVRRVRLGIVLRRRRSVNRRVTARTRRPRRRGRWAGNAGGRSGAAGHRGVQVLRVLRLRPRPDEGPARGHAEGPVRTPRLVGLAGLIAGAVLLASPLAAQDDAELDPLEPDFTV